MSNYSRIGLSTFGRVSVTHGWHVDGDDDNIIIMALHNRKRRTAGVYCNAIANTAHWSAAAAAC